MGVQYLGQTYRYGNHGWLAISLRLEAGRTSILQRIAPTAQVLTEAILALPEARRSTAITALVREIKARVGRDRYESPNY